MSCLRRYHLKHTLLHLIYSIASFETLPLGFATSKKRASAVLRIKKMSVYEFPNNREHDIDQLLLAASKEVELDQLLIAAAQEFDAASQEFDFAFARLRRRRIESAADGWFAIVRRWFARVRCWFARVRRWFARVRRCFPFVPVVLLCIFPFTPVVLRYVQNEIHTMLACLLLKPSGPISFPEACQLQDQVC